MRTREDVLDLAFDHIFGDVRRPTPSPDWQADVRELVLGWRAAMLRHPWAPPLVGRPHLGPNVQSRTDSLRAALTEATWRRTADPATPDLAAPTDDELFTAGLDAILSGAQAQP